MFISLLWSIRLIVVQRHFQHLRSYCGCQFFWRRIQCNSPTFRMQWWSGRLVIVSVSSLGFFNWRVIQCHSTGPRLHLFFFFFVHPFRRIHFYLYMHDTLLSTSAPYRPSISDFSCTCGIRRRSG